MNSVLDVCRIPNAIEPGVCLPSEYCGQLQRALPQIIGALKIGVMSDKFATTSDRTQLSNYFVGFLMKTPGWCIQGLHVLAKRSTNSTSSGGGSGGTGNDTSPPNNTWTFIGLKGFIISVGMTCFTISLKRYETLRRIKRGALDSYNEGLHTVLIALDVSTLLAIALSAAFTGGVGNWTKRQWASAAVGICFCFLPILVRQVIISHNYGTMIPHSVFRFRDVGKVSDELESAAAELSKVTAKLIEFNNLPIPQWPSDLEEHNTERLRLLREQEKLVETISSLSGKISKLSSPESDGTQSTSTDQLVTSGIQPGLAAR